MLKWLFGGGKKKEASSGPQLCMPLLRSTEGVTAPRIIAAWAKLCPELPPLASIPDDESTKGSPAEVLGLQSGGQQAFIALMPAKIPGGEAERAAAVSWMWKPERNADLASYKAHAIVMTTAQPAIAAAAYISRLTACVIEAGQCVGVYWGNASMLHMPDLFKSMAEELFEGDAPMPPLWVNVLASGKSQQGPFTLSTRGMEAFGLDEFEIVDSTAPLGELRERLYSMASYVLENGPVLKDGHTIGNSEAERIKVRVGRSKLGKPGTVVRLEMA